MHSGHKKQNWDSPHAPCRRCSARITRAQVQEQPTLPARNETARSFTLKTCKDSINPGEYYLGNTEASEKTRD